MRIESQAIVCAVRTHGEHGAIVRALTPDDGLQPGFVRGGRSRRLRPILLPGNLVEAEYRARTDEQLAALTVELVRSRAPLFAEPLAAAAIDWTTALTASALPEGQAYPRLFAALSGFLDAVEAAPSARGWAAALVRLELLLLAELGFGLDRADWPRFVRERTAPDWPGLLGALHQTGHFLARDLPVARGSDLFAARDRLLDRLARVTR